MPLCLENMEEEVNRIINSYNPPLSEWAAKVEFGAKLAVEKEVTKLRRLGLPIIVSRNGKPFDRNPDTNPDMKSGECFLSRKIKLPKVTVFIKAN
jgi:hypothetical protein